MSTCKKIVDSFFKLYTIKDLDCITTREIIKLAGCNRSTFYDYYFDKYDVLETTKEFLLNHTRANSSLYLTVFLNENDIHVDMHSVYLVHKYENYLRPLLNKDLSFVNDYKNAIKSIFSGKVVFYPFDTPRDFIDDQVAANVTYQTYRYINGTIEDIEYIQSIKFLFQNAKIKYQEKNNRKNLYIEIIPSVSLRNGKRMEIIS